MENLMSKLDIYITSKNFPSKYILITKGKSNFMMEKTGREV